LTSLGARRFAIVVANLWRGLVLDRRGHDLRL
jgi:hypothetical protein